MIHVIQKYTFFIEWPPPLSSPHMVIMVVHVLYYHVFLTCVCIDYKACCHSLPRIERVKKAKKALTTRQIGWCIDSKLPLNEWSYHYLDLWHSWLVLIVNSELSPSSQPLGLLWTLLGFLPKDTYRSRSKSREWIFRFNVPSYLASLLGIHTWYKRKKNEFCNLLFTAFFGLFDSYN